MRQADGTGRTFLTHCFSRTAISKSGLLAGKSSVESSEAVNLKHLSLKPHFFGTC